MAIRDEKCFRITETYRFKNNPSVSAVRKWCETGLTRRKDGRVIRLESELLGGCRYTSEEAVERFYDRLNEE